MVHGDGRALVLVPGLCCDLRHFLGWVHARPDSQICGRSAILLHMLKKLPFTLICIIRNIQYVLNTEQWINFFYSECLE